jgi:hypothetical protein
MGSHAIAADNGGWAVKPAWPRERSSQGLLDGAHPDLPHPGAILAVRVGGIEQVPEPVRRPLQQFRLASLIQRAEGQALGGEGVAPQLTVVSVAVEIVVLEPHHTRRVSDDASIFPIMSSP